MIVLTIKNIADFFLPSAELPENINVILLFE
jgi:hypothetical protein